MGVVLIAFAAAIFLGFYTAEISWHEKGIIPSKTAGVLLSISVILAVTVIWAGMRGGIL